MRFLREHALGRPSAAPPREKDSIEEEESWPKTTTEMGVTRAPMVVGMPSLSRVWRVTEG